LAPKEFSIGCKVSPSSSKAECMAILTALIVSPDNCRVNIFTDSQTCIQNFHKIFNTYRYRKLLKVKNYHLWFIIKDLIIRKNLTVDLIKVKGHSNDPHNDRADELAKASAKATALIAINTRSFSHSVVTAKWADKFTIFQDFRKWMQIPLNVSLYNTYINNDSIYNLAPAIKESRINWSLTHKLFKRTPHLRHDKLTRIFSYRIKNINHSLPHGDLKHKHYPKLYTDPNTWCPLCNLYEDTNCHRSICTGFNSEIISILRKF